MASNSISLYSTNYPSSSPFTLTATVVENSYDVVANASNITITGALASGGVYFSGYRTPMLSVSLKDNNAQPTFVKKREAQISSLSASKPSASVTWTGDVVHADDGTLTVTVKAAWDYKNSGTGYAPISGEVSVNLVLTAIPRVGTVSLSSSNETVSTKNGSTIITATVTPQDPSNFHLITAMVGTHQAMASVWAEDCNYTADITDTDILNAMPDTATDVLVVEVLTFATKDSTGAILGTAAASANITIDVDTIKPILMVSNVTPSLLVAGYSTATIRFQAIISGTGVSGCTTSCSLSDGLMDTVSTTVVGSLTDLTTDVLPSSTTNYTITFTLTAVDSRGATSVLTRSATVYGYMLPDISLTAYRVATSSSTTEDEAGEYVYITYSASATNITGNTVAILTATYDGDVSGTLSGSPSWVALAVDQGMTISVTATDRYDTAIKTLSVPVAIYPIDLYQSGGLVGIGVGGVAVPGQTTVYHNLTAQRSTHDVATYVRAKNDLASMDLEISASGLAGLYSTTYNGWTLYTDTDGHVHIPDVLRSVRDVSASSYTLPTASGQAIRFTYSGSTAITIPSDLPAGYECYLQSASLNNRMAISCSGSDRIYVKSQSATVTSYTTTDSYDSVHLIKLSATMWMLR